MVDLVRRQVVLGSVLVAGGVFAQASRPQGARRRGVQSILDRGLPLAIGPWQGRPIPAGLTDERDGQDLATYDGYVVRKYAGSGVAPIYLVVAYGSSQDLTFHLHRPEVCYPASGYTITASRSIDITYPGGMITGTAFAVSGNGRFETVLCWTRINRSFPGTVWGIRRAILGCLVRGQRPDGALVRISVPDLPIDAALPLLTGFAGQFLGATKTAARTLLLGPGR